MHLTPRQRFDSGIDDVGTVLANFEDAGHRQTRTAVSVILDDNLRIFLLDHLRQLAQESRLTDTCHIFQTDFLSTGFNHLVGDVHVVLQRVNRRGGDTERSLWCHTCLFCPLDAGDDVAHIVQTVEDTGDINTLSVLHLIHQGTNIIGHRIHTQCIQTAIQHVRLDASLVERLTESTNGIVGVLACQQVYLLEGSTIGFYTGKTAHFDNNGSNALQLIFAWLELTRTLPHVSINKTKLYFLFHI